MDPSTPLATKWRILTTIMHLLAVSLLSMCIARRTFFRITQRQTQSVVTESLAQSASAPNDLQQRDQNEPGPIDPSLTRRAFIPSYNCLFRYTIETTHARLSAFLVFTSSLFFALASAVLVLGVGLNTKQYINDSSFTREVKISLHPAPSCVALIYLCIFCYGATKVFIYMFLVERVYLVVSAGCSTPRRRTVAYKCGFVGIVVYVVILVLVTVGRIAKVVPLQPLPYVPFANEDENKAVNIPEVFRTRSTQAQYIEGICTIGIEPYGTIPFIAYDIVLTVLLTILFAFPLMSTGEVQYFWSRWCPLKSRREEAMAQTSTPPCHLPPNNQIQQPISDPLPHSNPSQQFCEDIGMSMRPGELRRLAIRSTVSSLVALTSSAINLVILTSNHGQEEAMTCMRWCLADVVINCLATFCVMRGRDEGWKRDSPVARLSESLFGAVWQDRETECNHSHSHVHGPRMSSLRNPGAEVGLRRTSIRHQPQRNAQVRSLPGRITSPMSVSHYQPGSERSPSNSIRQPSCPWTISSASLPAPERKRSKEAAHWDEDLRNDGAGSPVPSIPGSRSSPLTEGLMAMHARRSTDISELKRNSMNFEGYSRTNRLSLQLPVSSHKQETSRE